MVIFQLLIINKVPHTHSCHRPAYSKAFKKVIQTITSTQKRIEYTNSVQVPYDIINLNLNNNWRIWLADIVMWQAELLYH